MFDELHLKDQIICVRSYIQDNFTINLEDLPEFEPFSETLIKCIISIKIWDKYLKQNSKIPSGPEQYLTEISSNLTQILVMGVIGLKVPSYIMVRRSLENIMNFLYYMDHNVEFLKKESEMTRDFLRISDLKRYMETYPFDIYYTESQSIKVRNLMKDIMRNWQEQYSNLSNFVHGTNREYLELRIYLEDIKPENSTINSLMTQVQKFSNTINTLNILFFFHSYKNFDQREQSFIRNAISEEFEYKKEIRNIFGDL